MLTTTKAIVLHRIRHKDNRLVVTLFTAKDGLMFALFYQKKKGGRTGLLEPLSLIDTVISSRPTREIQDIREIRLLHPLQHIRTDIRKTSIAIFLAELILNCVRHAPADLAVFEFLYDQILKLDHAENPSDFHVRFMTAFAMQLGIGPSVPSGQEMVFDPESAIFVGLPNGLTWPVAESKAFANLIHDPDAPLLGSGKQKLLGLLLEYYGMHLHIRTEMRSREVLTAVFS